MLAKLRKKFITFSLTLLIVLIILNAVLIFYNRQVMIENTILQRQTAEVKAVWTSIFEGNLRRMDMGLRGYALVKNPQLLDPYYTGIKDLSIALTKIDSLLGVQKLDSLRGEFASFLPKVHSYVQYTDQMRKSVEANDMEQFFKLLNEDRGFDLWKEFAPMFHYINPYQDKLLDQAEKRYEQAMDRNIIFQAILVLLTIPTILVVIYRIKQDAKNQQRLLTEFEQSNRTFLFNPGTENVIKADAIIQTSINNLRKASSFVKDIAQGNYAVRWEGLTQENEELNKENLAGDLVRMRDQMKKVKEQDERRIWSTEGLSKFSDVVRNNQNNIEKLSNEVIRFLTKHLRAQQGSLFVLRGEESEESYLELAACFAFDKKKFIEKKIDIGSGLVGQAFQEGGTILLTDLPQGYTKITSGLGDATPSCVIIVPVKYNERVEAVLELASFTKLEPHEIEFLEKAGEVIGSSIYSTKTNERTEKLLKETQEQAEALRSQEEELRQNMEELQATQEDMRRRELQKNMQATTMMKAV